MTAAAKNLSVAALQNGFICKILIYGVSSRLVQSLNQQRQNFVKTLGLQSLATMTVSWLHS